MPTTTGNQNVTSKAAMTDGQISKILLTINQGEIEAAKWAKKHAANKDVKNFAKEMYKGHEKNKKATQDMAKNKMINLEDSELNKTIQDEASNSNNNLKALKRDEMDKVYISQQIMMHQNALNHINNTLIPNASSPDLRAHLEKTRDDVSAHLNHAQELQTKIQ
tara:strand:+ start:38684 stop:39175 length:492 start_codon:yes stop_codon:yes gene_type:complete